MTGLIGILLGVFCILAGLFDWVDKVFSKRHWKWFDRLAGNKGTRIYFIALGILLIIVSITVLVGQ